MKKYKVTVNGQSYEVEVEEIGGEMTTSPSVQPASPSQPQKVSAQPPKAPTAPKKPSAQGAIQITSPMPGTIVSIKVSEGAKVSKGDVIMILEAMKMENEIQAPQDSIVASINVAEGASVNTGDILATFE